MKMSAIDLVAYVLVLVGGLNWGLVGFFKFNLVAEIFGPSAGISRVIYALVGLATLYVAYKLFAAGASKDAEKLG